MPMATWGMDKTMDKMQERAEKLMVKFVIMEPVLMDELRAIRKEAILECSVIALKLPLDNCDSFGHVRENISKAIQDLVNPPKQLSPFGCECWLVDGIVWQHAHPKSATVGSCTNSVIHLEDKFCRFCGNQRVEGK